ncbi:O-antigen ligase family protein [Hufsiella ginkgonis]|uniref:O-antigen ligase-related domain-containing protein n=1 Tax=Hufsiella ginkgonis TaxID=2695274 RepID=A0A7K1XSU1_9SPHI|nr:O-antigen ligase family protein [Hufsiella ginkgonis]MXV14073.1 hypothetical protein [Hufsiella ginkgonis]
MKINIGNVFSVVILSVLLVLFCGIALAATWEAPRGADTGKFFIYTGAALLLLVLSAVQLVIAGRQVKLNKIDFLLLVLYGYVILNRYVFQSDPVFSLPYYEFCGLGIGYLILRQLTLRHLYFLLIAMVTGGFLQAVYGNLQLYGIYALNNGALTGNFKNTELYANYLATCFPVSLGLFMFHNELSARFLQAGTPSKPGHRGMWLLTRYVPLAGAIAVILMSGATRSMPALFAMGGSTLLLLGFKYQVLTPGSQVAAEKKERKTIGLALSALLLGGVLAGAYFFGGEANKGRLLIWKVSAILASERPLTGHGFDRFQSVYMNGQAKYLAAASQNETEVSGNVTYAYNDVLQFTVENGLAGICCILLVVVTFFMFKKQRFEAVHQVALSGILSVALLAFLSFPMQELAIKLGLVLFLAIVIAAFDAAETDGSRAPRPGRAFKGIALLGALTFSIFGFNRVVTLYKGYTTWNRADDYYKEDEHDKTAANFYYDQAYPLFARNGEFLASYGNSLSHDHDTEKAIAILLSARNYRDNSATEILLGNSYKDLKNFKLAEQAYLRAHQMAPNKFYARYSLATLYMEADQRDKAREIALSLLNKKDVARTPVVVQMLDQLKQIVKAK